MTYAGIAQTSCDVNDAVALAARTFHPTVTVGREAIEDKRPLVSPFGKLNERDVVILKTDRGEINGACFLVDREFYRSGEVLRGTFLGSICIDESWRGRGLSKRLMEAAIAECERRGSAFAILIARRAVDHFYNKFFFWGLSQYSTIRLKLPQALGSAAPCSFSPAVEDELAIIGSLYHATYSDLYGSCVRSAAYWRHLLWRTQKQQRNFLVYRVQGRICGYAVFSGENIYEVASREVSCLDLLRDLGQELLMEEITVRCTEEHPIVRELHNVDFSMAKRQCSYGGHMVRVINQEVLLEFLIRDAQRRLQTLGVENYRGAQGDIFIEAYKGKVNMTFTGPPYTFSNTCFLMGADHLSAVSSGRLLYQPKSFNVLLLDEV